MAPNKIIKINKKTPQKRVPKEVEQLRPKTLNVSLTSSFTPNTDVLRSVKYLLDRQWDQISMLNPDFQAHLVRYRARLPRIVLKNQLYSLHVNDNSFIDHEVVKLTRKSAIMCVINDNNEIKSDLIILKEDYFKIIDTYEGQEVLKFKEYIKVKQFSVIDREELIKDGFSESDINSLIKIGLLKLMTMKQKSVGLSIPNYGFFINLLKISKIFILRIVNSTKWKEIKLKELKEKWNKYKLRFKDFKGLSINWPLNYLIGSGQVEVFETFDGEKCIKMIH